MIETNCAFERNVKVMNLYSANDKILLKNCIVVKLKQLHMAAAKLSLSIEEEAENAEMLALEDEISYYQNFLSALKIDDITHLENLLLDSGLKEDYQQFNNHILITPAKEMASEYVNLTKSLMEEYNAYSDENFEALKKAFYKGNEHLLESNKTKNLNELEEEFEPQNETSVYLTEDIQNILEQLNRLFKQNNPKLMTQSDFQTFSSQFKNLTKSFALCKLQQSLDEDGQTLVDVEISRDVSTPIYQMDLKFSDDTHRVLTEKAYASDFMKSYTQYLCYSYLESSKYSLAGESCNIVDKMNIFSECHKKLIELSKCKLNILANNTLGISAVTSAIPSKDLDTISAHAKPDGSDSREEI